MSYVVFVIEGDLHAVHKMSHSAKDQQFVIELLQFEKNFGNELEFAWGTGDPVLKGYVVIVSEESGGIVSAVNPLYYQIGEEKFWYLFCLNSCQIQVLFSRIVIIDQFYFQAENSIVIKCYLSSSSHITDFFWLLSEQMVE